MTDGGQMVLSLVSHPAYTGIRCNLQQDGRINDDDVDGDDNNSDNVSIGAL